MALGLRFTDGSTTVNVSDGTTGLLLEWTPRVGVGGAAVESARVMLLGDLADVRTTTETLTRLFEQAAAYDRGEAVSRVYAETKYHDDTDWKRSPLTVRVTGMAGVDTAGAIAPTLQAVDLGLAQGKASFTVTFTRADYWEGAEAQVALTNDNGTANTTGLPIYGINDGDGTAPAKRVNYAEIAAASVLGDLPAPTRLELTNAYNDADELSSIWIGQNWTDPAGCVWAYEAEAGATGAPAVGNSGGQHVVKSVYNSEQVQLAYTLTAEQLSAFGGQAVHAVLRFGALMLDPSYLRFRLRLKSGASILWSSPQVMTATDLSKIHDLYALRMPPWLPSTSGALTLELLAYSANTRNVYYDTLYLMPADGWRVLKPRPGAAYGEVVVDDAVTDRAYVASSGGAAVCPVLAQGQPIHLAPGKRQRLYLLLHGWTTGGAEVDRLVTAKLYYRPRWRAL